MSILSEIFKHKLIAIIRGADPADVPQIVKALYKGGIRIIEITLNSQDAFSVIERISFQVNEALIIGAGTVLDAPSARSAIAAGAKFIISPTVDPETIHATKNLDTVSIPGAYTPTEILQAYREGGDIIKLFPASGPQYLRDIRGPLSHIPLMPTGGINLDNIRDFEDAGAVAFGIGSSLVKGVQKITDEWLGQLTVKAAEFVTAIAKH